MQAPAGQPGLGSPWSLFEDQVLFSFFQFALSEFTFCINNFDVYHLNE